MSLESFIGFDSNEPMSESAFEALKERMRQAQAQIAAIKKEENKQKKKEVELIHVLLKFIQSSQKKDLVLLVSRVLEKNLPANFVLAVILLGNRDIQNEVGQFLMLKGPENETENSKSLVFFQEDQTLPLKAKIELDQWLKTLLYQAEESPHKFIKSVYSVEKFKIKNEEDYFSSEVRYKTIKKLQESLIKLISYVTKDFLSQMQINESTERSDQFAEFILAGIVKKTEELLENRNLLS